jgi:hypothetical protein
MLNELGQEILVVEYSTFIPEHNLYRSVESVASDFSRFW